MRLRALPLHSSILIMHDQLFVQMALSAWNTYIRRTNDFFEGFTDEELYSEIAPGKNRLIYLLGHLVAVHDRMFELFEIGERQFKHLDEPFLQQPDKSVTDLPSASTLRDNWKHVNNRLTEKMKMMEPNNWFSRHSAISPEEFEKEPERNKLNVLINRTNHLAYHFGQLMLVRKA